jgi:putative ABC transport system permease protein
MTAFVDTIAMALSTLRANPLRSLLTLLGIVIGAATVVAMMALTEGLRLRVSTDLAVLGAGAFHVQKFPAISFGGTDWAKYAKRKELTLENGEVLKAACPQVSHVSVELYENQQERLWTKERATQPNIEVAGVTPDYEYAAAVTIAEGRFISATDLELGRNVAVIGADVADLLFPGQSAVGEVVRLRSSPFEIIGVFERMGTVLGLGSKDAIAVFPIPAYQRTLGMKAHVELTIQATTPDDVGKAEDEVTSQLRRLRGVKEGDENDFEIFTNDSLSETFNNLAAIVAAATLGVCALSLLVGGIGIMNIMLVSVAERTREIGIRKALGARRRRTLSQFLVEAVTLSLLGGLLGVLGGMTIAAAAHGIWEIPAKVPSWAVALALTAASGTGLVFGIYPAARASKLDPVEAMRSE